MANPLLSDKAFKDAAAAGWAAPDSSMRSTQMGPITDGPTTPWPAPTVSRDTMTVNGTVSATGVLMVLLLAAAAVGWQSTSSAESEVNGFPMLALGGVLVGFGCAIAVHFKPMWAKVLGPIYALAQGFFVGVISHAYNDAYDGIVVQAVGATLAVFATMLVLYRTRIIKVTDRFRRIVVAATIGLMVFYLLSFVARLIFGADSVTFLQSGGMLGIAFSLFAAGLAAFNLALDFDFIERGSQQNLPKGMEWFAAFGLLVTIVWLYLELLRLLAKLQRR
jgi:uncharacterized YccA/Bax inhibitor family protein